MAARVVRRGRGDRGAAVVEFAIVLPVVMVLLLGMVTGAAAWNQSQSIGHGGQIGARWAATLPLPDIVDATTMDDWLDLVIDRSIAASSGEMDAGVDGRAVCVAYVDPNGASADTTFSRRLDANGIRTNATTECFSDGQDTSATRIQVAMERSSFIDIGFHRSSFTLTREVIFRYEADSGL